MLQIPRIKIGQWPGFRAYTLSCQKSRFDCCRDTCCYLVLKCKYVSKFPVKSFRPNVITGQCVYELAGDAYLLAGLADTSLKNVAHAEFTPHLLYVDGFAFVNEG